MDIRLLQVSKWNRPTPAIWPRVWHRYEITKNGRTYRIKIQDIPEDRFEDVVNFMSKEFEKNEPISACKVTAKLLKDKEVRLSISQNRWRILREKMSLFAVPDDDDNPKPKIMGVALHFVTSPKFPFYITGAKKFAKAMEIAQIVQNGIDVTNLFNGKEHIEDFGLCVAEKYYGLGISYNIFKALEKLAKAFDIAGSKMVFSSKYSQESASKAGFQLLNEMNYEDYRDSKGKVKLPIKDTKSIKYMYILYS